MRRTASMLFSGHAGAGRRGIPQALADVLVCPLSKKPLRYCEASGSLVSDAVGVSFPIEDGIPCLVPKDGMLLEDNSEKSEQEPSPAI
ncbi:UPF0434 protein Mmar10_2939-like [Panicum virgatum]|uniref:Protein preY, mitochondrial n=1 Tax=Panicum virgatum TaxID=38727 RepID=A0A8T0MMC6_PANVG|nr:UPF0434 protein Mmar10_2939-like [Panicum virgatum]KAG2537908.1 hypothetical protein PVAP13_9NG323700 [Panicum virgatum]